MVIECRRPVKQQCAHAYPSSEIASRIQIALWQLRGLKILVSEVYLCTCKGASTRNLDLMQHVTITARTLGAPLLLFGDFQMAVTEIVHL